MSKLQYDEGVEVYLNQVGPPVWSIVAWLAMFVGILALATVAAWGQVPTPTPCLFCPPTPGPGTPVPTATPTHAAPSPTSTPPAGQALVCCVNGVSLWTCAPGDAACKGGPFNVACSATPVASSACAGVTPTPAPGTPTPTPTVPPITIWQTQEIGPDPYGITPCFGDENGNQLEAFGGSWLCQSKQVYSIASSDELDDEPVLGTPGPVGSGGVHKYLVTQPLGPGTPWHLRVTTDTVDNPPPSPKAGWLWWQVANLNPSGGYKVSDNLTMYASAGWYATGTIYSHFGIQLAFQLPNEDAWAGLNIDLGTTPGYPPPDPRPGYVKVFPKDVFYGGEKLRYYAVLYGPGLGYLDPAALWKTGNAGAVEQYIIPVSALVRKVRAENPGLFDVPENALLGAYGIFHEEHLADAADQFAVGNVVRLETDPFPMWVEGPQALPKVTP